MSELQFNVYKLEESGVVTVYTVSRGQIPDIAQASYMPDFGHWYVNRVLVKSGKRKGTGMRLVKKMLELIGTVDSDATIVVEPGGYGSDVAELEAFYAKCGFATVEPGRMEVRLGGSAC